MIASYFLGVFIGLVGWVIFYQIYQIIRETTEAQCELKQYHRRKLKEQREYDEDPLKWKKENPGKKPPNYCI